KKAFKGAVALKFVSIKGNKEESSGSSANPNFINSCLCDSIPKLRERFLIKSSSSFFTSYTVSNLKGFIPALPGVSDLFSPADCSSKKVEVHDSIAIDEFLRSI